MVKIRGFVQVLTVVAILIGALIMGGAGFFAVQNISQSQITATKEPNSADVSASTSVQASEIAELRSEIDALKTAAASSTPIQAKQEVVIPKKVVPTPKPSTTSNVQTMVTTSQNQVPIPPPTAKVEPAISAFTVTPSSATLGDIVTFSWNGTNVVNCAVPVADPSKLAIPFTGHLPQGTLDYQVKESVSTQSFTYWLVCADKDWNTVKASAVLQLIGPHLEGTPRAAYDNQGVKRIYVVFKGATTAHLTCVNSRNASDSNAFKFVDTDVYTVSPSSGASAVISSNANAGTPLTCTIEFGDYSGGNFEVWVP